MTKFPLSAETLRDIFRRIPSLSTERLLLRRCIRRDAEDMYEYSCRRDVAEYLLWPPHRSLYDSERLLRVTDRGYRKGREYVWSVVLRNADGSEGKMIGTVCFTRIEPNNNIAEIGYVLSPDYWRRGYGREAGARLIKYGFETLGFERIEARIMSGNAASRALAESVGMSYEGTLRSAILVKGTRRDVSYYSILREEYLHGKGKA